mmetsp:Transcript_91195/g.244187  ORF Transcript_91195/g.244187 Transcript_91195/m.244187 type:complete len:341 (+) Transcript_91195:347-1369(+)
MPATAKLRLRGCVGGALHFVEHGVPKCDLPHWPVECCGGPALHGNGFVTVQPSRNTARLHTIVRPSLGKNATSRRGRALGRALRRRQCESGWCRCLLHSGHRGRGDGGRRSQGRGWRGGCRLRGLGLLLSSITPIRALSFFHTHSLRRRLRVVARLFVLIIRPIQTLIASWAFLTLRHQAREQLRHGRILDHEMFRRNLRLATLQVLLLESPSLAVVREHAADLLGGLPLPVPILLPTLYTVAAPVSLCRLARSDHLLVLLLCALSATLVLRAPLLAHLSRLPSRRIVLSSGVVRFGDLGVHRLSKISALCNFRPHCGVELAALEADLLESGVLTSKIPL